MGSMFRIGTGLVLALMAATPVLAETAREAVGTLSSIRIPEPSDMALFAIGLMGLAIGRWSGRGRRKPES